MDGDAYTWSMMHEDLVLYDSSMKRYYKINITPEKKKTIVDLAAEFKQYVDLCRGKSYYGDDHVPATFGDPVKQRNATEYAEMEKWSNEYSTFEHLYWYIRNATEHFNVSDLVAVTDSLNYNLKANKLMNMDLIV